MTPTVTLKISSPHNDTYPTTILRKFFNMVFVDHKGKRLHIYTATVFGGANGVYADEARKNLPKPANLDIKTRKICSLRFKYEVQDEDNSGEPVFIECKQISNITKDFIEGKKPKSLDQIKQVWGEIEPLPDEAQFMEAMSKLYPDDSEKCRENMPDFTQSPAFRITDDKGRSSHNCVAYPGTFDQSKPNQYTLSAPNCVGVEAINWIKTTIELNSSILSPNNIADRKIEFIIKFEGCSSLYTPDFTWYFAPPPNYIVDDLAEVDIGTTSAIPNIVSPVSDSTTVMFKEWLDENILERKKYRVLMGDYTSANPYVLSNSQVKVSLSFSNPKKHGNLQFLVGLLVSHFLSVYSDMGRLEQYRTVCNKHLQGCISENICNLLSILFTAAFILAFFAFCFRQNDCIPKKGRTKAGQSAIISRWIGLCSTVFLALYINLGWLVIPGVMQKIVKTCVANQIIVFVAMLLSLIGTGFYTIYCWYFKKKHLIDFL